MYDPKNNDFLQKALDGIRELSAAASSVGDPIETPAGVTVIPISRVSVGFVSGGADGTKKVLGDGRGASVGGTGIRVTPVAFLTVSKGGAVDLLPVGERAESGTTALEKLIELVKDAPAVIERVKKIFS